MNHVQSNMCRNTLWKLGLFSLAFALLLLIFSDFVTQVYTSNQQTSLGFILNGLIVALFLFALLRLLLLLLHYRKEEVALNKFQWHLQDAVEEPLYGVDDNSMIAMRYRTIHDLSQQETSTPINHQALAATLMATESTRSSSIRFVHNILILCGVFGTIVSLSIALFGASSLLESAVSSSGMGMVIHGMSTALSTTMTAIVCYLFLGYFFGALQDVQTHVLSRIEHITTTRLLPPLNSVVTSDSVNEKLYELMQTMAQMLQGMGQLTKHMQQTQQELPVLVQALKQHMDKSEQRDEQLLVQMQQIQTLLRQGFRLSGDKD